MSSLSPAQQVVSGRQLLQDVTRLAQDPVVRRRLQIARRQARSHPEVVQLLAPYLGRGIRLLES